jgi:hypothetical protein
VIEIPSPSNVDTTPNELDTTNATDTRVNGAGIPLTKLNKSKGRPGTTNLHAKYPSSIATRLKAGGVDWTVSFGKAIQRNDKVLLKLWVKLLPYLIVTGGHRRVKRFKGRASKAALNALAELEGR